MTNLSFRSQQYVKTCFMVKTESFQLCQRAILAIKLPLRYFFICSVNIWLILLALIGHKKNNSSCCRPRGLWNCWQLNTRLTRLERKMAGSSWRVHPHSTRIFSESMYFFKYLMHMLSDYIYKLLVLFVIQSKMLTCQQEK